ncbi:MAG: hypothetical protein Q9225_005997, partial [Loekoesia sp. 1 TL-2023]
MLLLHILSLLALSFGSSCAASFVARQEAPNPAEAQNTALDASLDWERVSLPGDDSNVLVTCSAYYGSGLDARSCFDALQTGPHGPEQETWVENGPLPPGLHNPVRLPVILFSNDTKCLIKPAMQSGQTVAHASALNITEAARSIIQGCVIRRRLGGAAHQIGGDNKLAVMVLANNRPIQCTEAIQATTRSCQYILDEMDKDLRTERFGRGDPQITVALPLTLRA